MRRSVTFEVNVLRDEGFGDIDERNSMVDEAIEECPWFDEDKHGDMMAQDIEYTVISCQQNGDAVIKATFRFE